MYELEDYKQFLSFLSNDEGIDIKSYIEEFSKIKDILLEIDYICPSRARLKFSQHYDIFGFEVMGLLFSNEYNSHYHMRLAVPADNELGFKMVKIPYNLNFVQELYKIVKHEVSNIK